MKRKTRTALCLVPVVVIAALVPLAPTWRQKSDEVAIRPPGHRFLETPVDARAEAKRHVDYARLSDVVYRRVPDGRKKDTGPAGCPAPEEVLTKRHWARWDDFLEDKADDVTKAAVNRSGAEGFHWLTGIWPGAKRPEIE